MAQEITIGSSGQYVSRTASGYQEIPSGSSGDILVISDINGADVRLESLFSSRYSSSPFGEINMEIEVDGGILISGPLGGGSPLLMGNGGFSVLQNSAYVGGDGSSPRGQLSSGYISDVVGKEIIVRKTSGTTVYDMSYSFSVGKS